MKKWSFVFLVSLIGLYIGYDHSIHLDIFENDKSYLSWIIMILWIFGSVSIGRRIFVGDWSEWVDLNFLPDAMVALGMIGTVVGFIMTMTNAFVGLNFEDIQTFTNVVTHVGTGIGTALWTTLIGLVFSLNLKLQLVASET